MKKLFYLLALSIIVITGCNNYNSKNDSEYLIGCSCPLTGEGANYGRSVKEGVDLAVDQINKENYLQKKLKIVYGDDKMDPKEGVNVMNKLISADNVPVIIGPFGSSIVLSTAPVAERNKTILISASATADDIKNAGDYIFRITPPNSKQGSDIADFCFNTLKCKRAAILYQNNDYGTTLKEAFENKFSEDGGEIVLTDGVILNTSDLKTQLLKIKNNNPDVVFFPLHYKESAIMLKQAKELGLKSYFISADGAMTEDMLKAAGSAADGSFYSTLALGYGKADKQIEAFEKLFEEKYEKDADIYNAYYYEVTWIIAKAIKEAGYKVEDIKNYLYSMKDDKCFNGITGSTCFDVNGEVDKAFYIYIVRNRKYELYK